MDEVFHQVGDGVDASFLRSSYGQNNEFGKLPDYVTNHDRHNDKCPLTVESEDTPDTSSTRSMKTRMVIFAQCHREL